MTTEQSTVETIVAEATMHGGDTIELWAVRGLIDRLYPTKIIAERAARIAFAREDERTRYGRISFARFHREER